MTWTLGGLEGPMVLLWLAWGGAAIVRPGSVDPPRARALLLAGLPFALLCLTRPDGPLWAATTALVLGAAALPHGVRTAAARMFAFAALPLGATLGQLAFRVGYYGDTVPNTAHVKVDLGGQALRAGLEYTGHSLLVLLGILLPALLGAVLGFCERSLRTATAALLLPVLAWIAYVTAIGGDHFPGYRLWHGALAPLALLAGLGLQVLGRTTRGKVTAAAVATLGLAGSLWTARTDWLSVFARTETWEWDGKIVGEVLGAAFAPQQPRLAVDAAGAVPYWSRLPALDMLGLCDRTIATSPPPAFVDAVLAGNGRAMLAGHMRGNGRYVMDRQPDLVLFSNPPGLPLAVFLSGLDFEADPRWLEGYRCVVVETGPRAFVPGGERSLSVPLWLRVEGRAGVRRGGDRIEVPAVLLGAYRQPRAFRFSYDPPPKGSAADLDLAAAWTWFTQERERFVAAVPATDGALELELRAQRPAALELDVPPGRWRLEPDRAVALAFTLGGAAVTAADGAFRVAGTESQRVVLTATLRADAALPLRLRAVTLVKVQ